MSRKRRIPRTSIFIACEGKNTEPIYFERIKEEVEDCNHLSIEVYPDRSEEKPKTHAIGLIQEAKSRIDYFDEVWVVFDKNGYTKHQEAFEEANEEINGKRVNIVFSSISFEHWVLLHFEKNETAYLKSADLIEAKFTNNETYFTNYSKRSDIDIYPTIKSNIEFAIENASWLRFKQKVEISSKPIYEVNPYTDVDVLFKRLFGIEQNIIWSGLNEEIKLKGVTLIINLNETNLTGVILNTGKTSLISTQFRFSNIDAENNNSHVEIEKVVVNPQMGAIFNLSEKTENVKLVKIEFENEICFVEI